MGIFSWPDKDEDQQEVVSISMAQKEAAVLSDKNGTIKISLETAKKIGILWTDNGEGKVLRTDEVEVPKDLDMALIERVVEAIEFAESNREELVYRWLRRLHWERKELIPTIKTADYLQVDCPRMMNEFGQLVMNELDEKTPEEIRRMLGIRMDSAVTNVEPTAAAAGACDGHNASSNLGPGNIRSIAAGMGRIRLADAGGASAFWSVVDVTEPEIKSFRLSSKAGSILTVGYADSSDVVLKRTGDHLNCCKLDFAFRITTQRDGSHFLDLSKASRITPNRQLFYINLNVWKHTKDLKRRLVDGDHIVLACYDCPARMILCDKERTIHGGVEHSIDGSFVFTYQGGAMRRAPTSEYKGLYKLPPTVWKHVFSNANQRFAATVLAAVSSRFFGILREGIPFTRFSTHQHMPCGSVGMVAQITGTSLEKLSWDESFAGAAAAGKNLKASDAAKYEYRAPLFAKMAGSKLKEADVILPWLHNGGQARNDVALSCIRELLVNNSSSLTDLRINACVELPALPALIWLHIRCDVCCPRAVVCYQKIGNAAPALRILELGSPDHVSACSCGCSKDNAEFEVRTKRM